MPADCDVKAAKPLQVDDSHARRQQSKQVIGSPTARYKRGNSIARIEISILRNLVEQGGF
jgi:hypothetical protein